VRVVLFAHLVDGTDMFALTFLSAGATSHFTSPHLTCGPTNGVSAPSTDSPSPKHRARSSSSILLTKLTKFAQHSHLCLLNTHVYESISSSSQDADNRPLPHPLERSRLRSFYCTCHPLHSHQSSLTLAQLTSRCPVPPTDGRGETRQSSPSRTTAAPLIDDASARCTNSRSHTPI